MDTSFSLSVTLFFTYFVGIILFHFLLSFFKKKGWTSRDMYKPGKMMVPDKGGIGLFLIFLIGIAFLELLLNLPDVIYISMIVLLLYFLFGLADDLWDIGEISSSIPGRSLKVLIPILFSYPLFFYTEKTVKIPHLFAIKLGILYPLLFLPVYVMVSANLMNMFSYYNGQSSGAAAIILVFSGIELYSQGSYTILYLLIPLLASTLAFLSYNVRPAGVFPGDCGDMVMGAGIGVIAILGNIEAFIFVALIPLIINFLMTAPWLLMKKGKIQHKYGTVRDDGTIDPPSKKTLMWLIPSYWRLSEDQMTLVTLLLVIISCSVSLFFF